ncbi:hypothetical protein L1987_49898 [Smallanthus sonchifolius]|uniref:Uncharacterized protein n=1 Tax=Smallanthus sonchifolius TaxID=185202 RepID=A0ACB9FW08_9ASTR|nr:hypothetical protein L1987_49898 [Smallanthus sonchifolius]
MCKAPSIVFFDELGAVGRENGLIKGSGGWKLDTPYSKHSQFWLYASRETPEVHTKAWGWETLRNSACVLVPGGFGDRGVTGMILAAKKYNFDPVNEKPLPRRYEWVKLDALPRRVD